ncbi:MAG: hypothetical protein NUV98_02750 [Candidatus Roizmanbacteria bacterium]|nr:hypothetical protein [Candidatus Roizmanbacteria bacterium]
MAYQESSTIRSGRDFSDDAAVAIRLAEAHKTTVAEELRGMGYNTQVPADTFELTQPIIQPIDKTE